MSHVTILAVGYLKTYGELASTYVNAELAKNIFCGLFAMSGSSKLAPFASSKLWPGLPLWFWYVACLYELSMAAAMWVGRFDIALPMVYVFLGGTTAANLVLKSPNFNAPLMVAPIGTLGLVGAIGVHAKVEVTPLFVYYLLGGFLLGVVLESLGQGDNKKKTK